jgi:hypothetical protein
MSKELKNSVKFYIASLDTNGKELNHFVREKSISGLKYILSKLNGGYTVYEALGGYLDTEDKTIEEKITVIESFTDSMTYAKVEYLKELATQIKSHLNQESMAIQINSKMVIL